MKYSSLLSSRLKSSKRSAGAARRNAIFTLTFYRHQGQWVFDDERRDIFVEPLVCGADDVFDVISGRCDDESINCCTVNFSSSPIPGFALHATYLGPEFDGSRYSTADMTPDTPFEFWLCPALFAYFDRAPKNLYVQYVSSEST